MDISHAIPGVIVYEFLPTREALEYALAGAAVGVGAAIAERYGVSAVVRVAVRGMIQTGSSAAAAYLETGLQMRAATAALRY
jgi:RsiW-degrading membrane proteinase PrsW (M82 family)